jgi:predicted ATP-dependent endonuclease of OLD family
MHLKRIKVNNFRALKNIQIDFESDFSPRIFPLASRNGGGKSTLLQLTFILLHCSASQDPDQLNFIKNLLSDFRVKTRDALEELAIFTIVHNQEEYRIRFYACQDTYINNFLASSEANEPSNTSSPYFSSIIELQENEKKRDLLEFEAENIKWSIDQVRKLSLIEDPEIRYREIRNVLTDLGVIGEKLSRIFEEGSPIARRRIDPRKIEGELLELLKIKDINLGTANYKCNKLHNDVQVITRCLEEKHLNYVSTYYINGEDANESLLYQVDGLARTEALNLLESISCKIFIASPSTQIYLFLSKKDRLSIFKTKESKESSYFQALEKAKSKLGKFLSTYDFFETRFLIDLFTQARDKDFQYAIENKGEYGTNYQNLLTEINSILPGKSINVTSDLSQITFSMTIDSEECSLLPEDLSHGELKKLNIYTWLKTYNINDAIVLMDEPEIALHPDWQYKLTNNLSEWGPSNQYILATHSYEICQPLTPNHVKEIEPKLLKDVSPSSNDSGN